MKVLESTDDTLNVDFYDCLQVKAWQKAGCTGEGITVLWLSNIRLPEKGSLFC